MTISSTGIYYDGVTAVLALIVPFQLFSLNTNTLSILSYYLQATITNALQFYIIFI